jgi:hypothetical protein
MRRREVVGDTCARSRAASDVSFGGQLVEGGEDGVPGQVQLPGQRPRGRKAGSRGQAALEDRVAQRAIEAPVERLVRDLREGQEQDRPARGARHAKWYL